MRFLNDPLPETSYPCDICNGDNQRRNEGELREVKGVQFGRVENYLQLTMWACEVCFETYHLT